MFKHSACCHELELLMIVSLACVYENIVQLQAPPNAPQNNLHASGHPKLLILSSLLVFILCGYTVILQRIIYIRVQEICMTIF